MSGSTSEASALFTAEELKILFGTKVSNPTWYSHLAAGEWGAFKVGRRYFGSKHEAAKRSSTPIEELERRLEMARSKAA